MNHAEKLVRLTDNKLFALCKEYGANARLWIRKFAGLLPEVYRRHLYKRRGYGSIYEFAAKLAGMNHDTVDKILRLSERLSDKPILHEQLENGEVGWSKIEKVAYVATPATDNMWAEKTKTLTQPALEEFVRQYRKSSNDVNSRLEVTLKSELGNQCTTTQEWSRISFPISPEVEFQLKLLKERLEKEKGIALTLNEVLKELLKGYHKTNDEKVIETKFVKVCENCIREKEQVRENYAMTIERNIPSEVQKVIIARSNRQCEFRGCNKPAKIYHHTRRFALVRGHDPDYIIWLCKTHEQLAHAGLIENEEEHPAQWRIRIMPDQTSPKFWIDRLVAKFRKGSEDNAVMTSRGRDA